MLPLLKDGDFVFGKTDLKENELKPYDIIIFTYRNEEVLCHYLWDQFEDFKTGQTLIQTRPLNPIWEKDDPVFASNIIAKVINKKIPLILRLKIIFLNFLRK